MYINIYKTNAEYLKRVKKNKKEEEQTNFFKKVLYLVHQYSKIPNVLTLLIFIGGYT